MAALAVTAAQVLPGTGCVQEDGIAGEAITAGKSVYLKAADNRIWLADSDASAAAAAGVGISLNGAAVAGAPIKYARGGKITLGADATMVVGKPYCVGPGAGGIIAHAELANPSYATLLGIAETAASLSMHVFASGVQIPA